MSKNKIILTDDSEIVWGKIPVSEYRKYFERTVGKYITEDPFFNGWLYTQIGKTLKETLEEINNPTEEKNIEELLTERRFNMISEPDKKFIAAFDKAINKLGYDSCNVIVSGCTWSLYMIVYGKTNTKNRPVIARFYIHEDGKVVLRLFFKNIDKHREYIESTPPYIKNVFADDCKKFDFTELKPEYLSDYINLLAKVYPIKIS